MRPKRVVLVASLADSLTNFRGPLLQRLVATGHDVVALAPSSPAVARELAVMGVGFESIPLSRTGLNPFRDAFLLVALVRTLRRLRPDCVLSYTIKPVIYGSLAARIARVPAVAAMITGLGFAFTEGEGRMRAITRGVAKTLYRVALQCADVVFFQNPDDRDLFGRLGLLGHARVVLINGSGVDLAHYAPAPLPKNPSFLMIARLVRDKGVVEYAEAARRLKERYPAVECVLAGWFDTNPAAVQPAEIAGWQEAGIVHFLGPLDDVRPALAACTVYVLPSYREGTPRTVLEAMATGRAIITTDVPGCRETIIDGDSGVLVHARDAGSLALAMARFVENPALAAQMGQRALVRVERKYDVHKVNVVIMDALGL